MTQPGKFDPSFVDPTDKVAQTTDSTGSTKKPVATTQDGAKKKFREVLERKIEQLDTGTDTSSQVAQTTNQAQSSSLFELASSSKTKDRAQPVSDTTVTEDDEMEEHIDEFQTIATSDTSQTDAPADDFQNIATTTTTDDTVVDIIDPGLLTQDVKGKTVDARVEHAQNLKEKYPLIPEAHALYQVVKKEEALPPMTMMQQATVQPIVVNAAYVAPDVSSQAARQAREATIALVEKLVSNLVVLTQTGRTDMHITLQHPPVFSGATLVITEFTSAKNEFNLSFYGLSPEARSLVAGVQQQETLRTSLIERGYTLHMITIESKDAPQIITVQEEEMDTSHEEHQETSQGMDQGTLT